MNLLGISVSLVAVGLFIAASICRPAPIVARPDFADPDYVVVGSGSTGSVLAGRLADAGFSVLVLEAGGGSQASLGGCSEPSLECPFLPGPGEANLTVFDIPLEWTRILSDPLLKAKYEWRFEKAHENTSLPSCARAVGGCGVHNAMIYMRGTPVDFAPKTAWEAHGWDWDTVLAAYKKSENNSAFPEGEHHSTKGPIQISMVQNDVQANASTEFLRACKSAGFESNADFNGESRSGCGEYQYLIRDGVRDSAAKAFIGDANRSLLRLQPYAHATRVLFAPNPGPSGIGALVARSWSSFWTLLGWPPAPELPKGGRRAVGVEYVDGASGLRRAVRCRREVIVSAGAVNTPKLLMLSGIGKAEELAKLGIPSVLEARAVGENLMDGVYAIAQFSLPPAFRTAWEYCTGRSASPVCLAAARQYKSHPRRGLFTSPGFSSGLFLRSPYAPTEAPDVQITFHPWDKFQRNWTEFLRYRSTSSAASHRDDYEKKAEVRLSVVTLEISNNHAKSRGSVKLRSADPMAPPVVDSPYLKNERDAEPLWWAMQEARKVMEEMGAEELLPGPDLNYSSFLDYLKCGQGRFRPPGVACDSSYLAVNHLGGTAQMGKVVDGGLRVPGVAGLRVADASVMPTLPSGNTHASCMMIGERAAELVLGAARGA